MFFSTNKFQDKSMDLDSNSDTDDTGTDTDMDMDMNNLNGNLQKKSVESVKISNITIKCSCIKMSLKNLIVSAVVVFKFKNKRFSGKFTFKK
jgi:hypothetical protein